MGGWADGLTADAQNASRPGKPLISSSLPRIAVGSLAEVAYIFQLVKDLDLIESAKWSELDQAREKAGRLTWGLYRSVRTTALR